MRCAFGSAQTREAAVPAVAVLLSCAASAPHTAMHLHPPPRMLSRVAAVDIRCEVFFPTSRDLLTATRSSLSIQLHDISKTGNEARSADPSTSHFNRCDGYSSTFRSEISSRRTAHHSGPVEQLRTPPLRRHAELLDRLFFRCCCSLGADADFRAATPRSK